MTPDLRQLRYFVAVAEELNFTRAAERLHMAQPPLSAAIRQLEEQLGVPLLARTTRQVELTPAGQVLLERGRALLRHADEVFAATRETDRAPVGRVAPGQDVRPEGRSLARGLWTTAVIHRRQDFYPRGGADLPFRARVAAHNARYRTTRTFPTARRTGLSGR